MRARRPSEWIVMRIGTPSSKWMLLVALALAGAGWSAAGQEPSDGLERGFVHPPQASRPRVWWHWMNGNVTKEGIEADLRWMKRVGIGGVQSFDASLFTPVVVEKRLAFMTPAVNGQKLGVVWREPFRVDVTGALREGANTLEITVTNLWVNRIIGDRQPGASRKYTYTSMPFYRASSRPLPSGLLGPVRLLRVDSPKEL